ncbi:hypothetical protein TSAR_004975 [Trichomalopsis sarcophagae]|uniref:Reverse transcriptase RNase H-like domain-containing protein n=1 Tax=Trichomalopsis sarcophagae TaxID=543379 RepID=A0A232EEE5_9HYME|nr:hypothetical protein TSAR_004975 [Trichomalopsis sarcophagae]
MLEGRPFTIHTNHRPLVYAATQRADKASSRQAHHFEFILRFDAKFAHTPGKDNLVADALSRTISENVETSAEDEEEDARKTDTATINMPTSLDTATINMPTSLDAATIEEDQKADGQLPNLRSNSSLNLQ